MATDVQQPDLVASGNITTAGGPTDPSSYVVISCGEGYSTWSADMRGTFSAGTTLVFEGTLDAQNWIPIPGVPVGSMGQTGVTYVVGPGPLAYQDGAAGLMQLRVRATTIAGGDNILINLRVSVGVESGTGGGGGGGGGSVTQGSVPWLVAGQGSAGMPATGVVTVQGITGGTPLNVTGSISAANPSVGLTGVTAPTSATEIGGIDPSGNLQAAGITLASTAATATQKAVVVAFSPNTGLPAGSAAIGSVTVTSGTVNVGNFPATQAVTQSTSPWVTTVSGTVSTSIVNSTLAVTQSGTWTVQAVQSGAPWSVTISGTPTVDVGNFPSSFGVTQVTSPWVTSISGTVAVTQSTSPWVTSITGTPNVAVTNFPAIQPVSQSGTWSVDQAGTWTVNQGSPNTLGNAWAVELTDGTNVLGTGSNPLRIDPTGTTTQPVAGTGTAGTPAAGVVTVQGVTGGTPVTIDGSITADNASVGLTGVTAPTSATEVGGIDVNGYLQAPGITLASTAATAAQQALVVTLSPVSAPISVAPVTISGPVDVVQDSTPWLTQDVPQAKYSQEDPVSGVQLNNLTSFTGLASPATAVNTACTYSSLGGEYYLNFTPASENLLGVFSYQVPVGHTLYITGVIIQPPVVTADMGGGACGQLWELFVASSSNPGTATGVRLPVATFGAPAGLFAGNNLTGNGVMNFSPQTPVAVSAGQWVLICYKVVGTGTGTGTFRGTCCINGYFD
jgi:hypothetical protein